jgi:CheY-like chemotaxis protein
MAKKQTVIVIDDDPDVLEATRTILEDAGYNVATAQTGEEGLARIRRGGIAAIILDVMMARETEGFRIAQDLRADAATARIPLVLMTAISQKTGFEFSPETDEDYMPVDAYLEKPVDPKRLVETIREVLKRPRTSADGADDD